MKQMTFDQLPEAVATLLSKFEGFENLLLKLIPPQEAAAEQVLTVHGAADFLSLAVPTIYNLVQRREIPFSRRAGSKRIYFSKAELTEWVKAGRKKTQAEIQAEAEAELAMLGRRSTNA